MKLQGSGSITASQLNKLVTELDARAPALEQGMKQIDQRDVYSETLSTYAAESGKQLADLPRNLVLSETLKPLLDRITRAKREDLEAARNELRATKSIADEIYYIAQSLGDITAGDATELSLPSAQKQYLSRKLLLGRLDTIDRALTAAGPAKEKFPVAQLAELRKLFEADVKTLEEAHGAKVKEAPVQRQQYTSWGAPPVSLPPADPMLKKEELATLAQAAAALGKLLKDAGLEGAVLEAANKIAPAKKESFEKNMIAFAQLADAATSALDYRHSMTEWVGLKSRDKYRAKAYDPYSSSKSVPRREASQKQLQEGVAAALKSEDPAAAAEKTLVDSFLKEIGATEDQKKNWAANAAAVREALSHELLFPLRALNERIDATISARFWGKNLEKPARETVDHILGAVLSGTYEDWIYSNPAGKQQLAGLDEQQVETWRSNHTRQTPNLSTREEGGLERFWITKIGGPSHGFDMFTQCLLPIVSNARTKAILVDDAENPSAAVARAYLRVLPSATDGKPVLYLEPLETDFFHPTSFGATASAVLQHAVEKAAQLHIPLAINMKLAGEASKSGLYGRVESMQLVLEPSNGVFEASDTLLSKNGFHDWVQTARETVVGPHALVIDPPQV